MKILTCYPLNDAQAGQIRQVVPDCELVIANQDNVASQLADSDVFCGHARDTAVDWESVVSSGRLKWIQSSAAGLDHCLTPAVINSGILVSGCAGLFRDSVAEQTMALLYGLVRSMPVFFRASQEKEFIRRPTDDLHGKTVGIVGFGGNGQRIAQFLRPVGVDIIATDRFVKEWENSIRLPKVTELLPAGKLDELLRRSDVVILTVPLDGSTERLMGKREFALMPNDSWFINVGRGRLVDEPALIEALNSGHLKGAGLDVTFTEPLPEESPLWNESAVLISPHVGAQSARRYQLVTDLFVENLGRFLRGERLKVLVDKQLGFAMPADRQ